MPVGPFITGIEELLKLLVAFIFCDPQIPHQIRCMIDVE